MSIEIVLVIKIKKFIDVVNGVGGFYRGKL